MAGSSFELLMQEIFNQKQRMDELLEENHTLRRQLTDLRVGHGIFLEIYGRRFALSTENPPSLSQRVSSVQDVPAVEQATISMPITETATDTPDSAEQTTITESTIGNIPETPLPDIDQLGSLPPSAEHFEVETAELSHTTFLEEMLIDEFAAAATSQIPVWRGSQTRKLPPVDLIDEEEKATLRKQLIGSFLLE